MKIYVTIKAAVLKPRLRFREPRLLYKYLNHGFSGYLHTHVNVYYYVSPIASKRSTTVLPPVKTSNLSSSHKFESRVILVLFIIQAKN